MSSTRKISIRKVIQTLVTICLVVGVVLAMMSADKRKAERLVKEVRITIESPENVAFLTENDIRNTLFVARHIDPLKQRIGSLDERDMEGILKANPWVNTANVFTDAEQVMHIKLTQRAPIVRIFEDDGNSYYLDKDLKVMPLSGTYTHYTQIVTGVPKLVNDTPSLIIKGTVVGLVNYLNRNPFWNAQVSQIQMRTDGGFELIPILGRQHIILGDTSRIASKLTNLLAFYKQIQNKIGWDKYERIDLRFEGQVVASPALQWKRPVDAALTNMSWLKAIMEHAPANQNLLGGDLGGNTEGAGIQDAAASVPVPKEGTKPSEPHTPHITPTAVARPLLTATQVKHATATQNHNPKPIVHPVPGSPHNPKQLPASLHKPKPAPAGLHAHQQQPASTKKTSPKKSNHPSPNQ